MIVIRPVTSSSDHSEFLAFPYKLNQRNPDWIPPLFLSQSDILSPKKNPFWQRHKHSFFLAMQNSECVGRIAAVVPEEHNRFFNSRDGFFGFLDAVDNPVVFHQLFDAAGQFLKDQKCDRVIGPLNPTIHHELGVVVDGFDQPSYYMLPQNPAYYDSHITRYGYVKLRDFYSYKMKVKGFQQIPEISRWKPNVNIIIRHPRTNDFQNELKLFFDIYNDAFLDHWGFSPISWDDFYHLAKDLKLILDPELVLIAEVHGQPVGFLLALPNLNELLAKIKNGRLFPFGFYTLLFKRKTIKTLRVITVAVKKKYQPLGIGSILYPALARKAVEKGFTEAELSWVVEDNTVMRKIARRVGAKRNKTYRLYTRAL